MDAIRLAVADVVVGFQIPPEHRVDIVRYLIGTFGRDRRLGQFIAKPQAYGPAIAAYWLREIESRGESALDEMRDKLDVWLRQAAHHARPDEPSAEDVLGYLLTGVDPAGRHAPLSTEQARDLWAAAMLTIGHRPCQPMGACRTCLALKTGRWGDVLKHSGTEPELVRELYRNFLRAGFPPILSSGVGRSGSRAEDLF